MVPLRRAFVAAGALAFLVVPGSAQALAFASAGHVAGGAAPSGHRPTPTPTPVPSPSPLPTPAPTPWRVVASQNPDPSSNTLSGVSAISSTDVWAVGQAGVSTLAEHWDGSSWTAVPTPNAATTGAAQNALLAVAAVDSTDVWAVGYSIGASYATMAMHWDGSSWRLVPTPNPPTGAFIDGPILTAVTAISSTDVWAVGGQLTTQYESPGVIEHWDGSAWSLVPAGALDNVACTCSLSWVAGRAASDVWTGGIPLLHWDGASWAQATASAGQGETAASASSTSNVWTVGTFRACGGETGCFGGPTSARFDGTSWAGFAPANPSGTVTLDGVAAFAPGDVWAVGFSGVLTATLTEHWNGSTWTVIPAPNGTNATSGTNVLKAVAGASGGDVWAVGSYFDGAGHTFTLIERNMG